MKTPRPGGLSRVGSTPDPKLTAITETLSQAVARRVRGLLAEQRISASALAREMGMSQAAMSRRTTGVAPMTLDELTRVAELLGVSEVDLVSERRQRVSARGRSKGSQVTGAKVDFLVSRRAA